MRRWRWRIILLKDVHIPTTKQVFLLLAGRRLSWLFLLQDMDNTVITLLLHWLFLLVTGTKECIPPQVALVVLDVTILEVGYPEVGKSFTCSVQQYKTGF